MFNPSSCPGPGDSVTHSQCHREHENSPYVDADDNDAPDDDFDLESASEAVYAECVDEDGNYLPRMLDLARAAMSDAKKAEFAALVSRHQDQAAGLLIRQHVSQFVDDYCERVAWEREYGAPEQAPSLLDAAKAVIARWDTPRWKDVPHTAEFIGRLRQSVSAEEAKAREA